MKQDWTNERIQDLVDGRVEEMREHCAKIAHDAAERFARDEAGCWSDGESAENACRQIEAAIRSGA